MAGVGSLITSANGVNGCWLGRTTRRVPIRALEALSGALDAEDDGVTGTSLNGVIADAVGRTNRRVTDGVDDGNSEVAG